MSNYEIWSLIISGISAFFGVGSFIAVWRIFCKTNQLTQRSKKGDKSQHSLTLMAQLLADVTQCIELSESRFLRAQFDYKSQFREIRCRIKKNVELLRIESRHQEWYSDKQIEILEEVVICAEELYNTSKNEQPIDDNYKEKIKSYIETFDKHRNE